MTPSINSPGHERPRRALRSKCRSLGARRASAHFAQAFEMPATGTLHCGEHVVRLPLLSLKSAARCVRMRFLLLTCALMLSAASAAQTTRPPDAVWTKFVSVKGQPEPVPAEWVSTPEGQYAHSIVIPNPVARDGGYRKGMTSEQYFHHLCNSEAGEFVFRRVQDVDGLVQLRSMEQPTDDDLKSRYALEHPDAAIYFVGGLPERLFVRTTRYHYFEIGFAPHHAKYGVSGPFTRFSGYDEYKDRGMKAIAIDRPLARYGFLWRGVKRPRDRENAIAGGEVIVIDTSTAEVLGVRRTYLRSGNIRNTGTGIWWLKGQMCLTFRDKAYTLPRTVLYDFIGSVAIPRLH